MRKPVSINASSHIENVFNNMLNDVSYIKLSAYSNMGK